MSETIKLGYADGSGIQVNIPFSHLIVAGVTQLSGKTTTLEALAYRSGKTVVAFTTKIGEKSFSSGYKMDPYFLNKSDYESVKSLIEAYSKEKLFLEKGTLMKLCKGSKGLEDIKAKVENLLKGKLRGIQEEIYTRLQHYLENLVDQISYIPHSDTFDPKLNSVHVMELGAFSEEAQSLIIQSVAEEVLKKHKNTILLIPEAWKFLPQKYNNPCKRTIESFIRQGAANKNFIWIDSQDMAGVDKSILKQVSTWLLGYQSERNEVKHTLDQLSVSKRLKPREEDIMTLKPGHFLLSSSSGIRGVYVQPLWLSDVQAISVANGGTVDFDFVKKSYELSHGQRPIAYRKQDLEPSRSTSDMQKQIDDLRDKVGKMWDFFSKPLTIPTVGQAAFPSADSIIQKVLDKLPKNSGNGVVYQVSPLEKLKKDFLIEVKQRIIDNINSFDPAQKKVLKFLVSRIVNCKYTEITHLALGLKPEGANLSKVRDVCRFLSEREYVELDLKHAAAKSNFMNKIEKDLGAFDASHDEIGNLYDHIIMEALV